MIPLQLQLSNFLSYGEAPQTLDFRRFHVACLAGANGHGKSALLDAITYALWGQARKGRHDRKPDEGLLRLGATQMRVDFTFALDEGTYRVIRTFRKRPKTTLTELELQLLDPDTSVYRPLSEAGALSVTQERIEGLLAMDYETFVNSAFLVQGRADAFTRKGPRERKELLARILGLARYDRLQDRARAHQQERQRQLTAVRQRAGDIGAELAGRAEVDRALPAVEAELTAAGDALTQVEAALELARERCRRAIALRETAQRLDADDAAARQALSRAEAEAEQLEARRRTDDALVADAAGIESRAEEHERLRAEADRCGEALQAARRCEAEVAAIERRIEARRHELERERATWAARREGLDERLADYDAALSEAQAIEAAYRSLCADRERLEAERQRRRTWEQLQRERTEHEHAIALERRRLEERGRGLGDRLREAQERLAAAPDLARRLQTATAALETATQNATEQARLREEGTALRGRVEQASERLAELETETQELGERLAAVGRGDLRECPLCGTALEGEHRHRLEAELAERRAGLAERRCRLEAEVGTLTARLGECRRRYRALEASADDLGKHQHDVALLRAQRQGLEQAAEARDSLQAELRDLEARGAALDEGSGAAGAVLVRVRAALEELAFDEGAVTRLEAGIAAAAEAEARHRVLATARREREHAAAERAQAEARVAEAEAHLQDGSFAGDDAASLEAARQNLAQLGYDEARHGQVRARLQELRQAPAARERLAAARARIETAEAALARARQEAAASRDRLTELEAQRRQVAAELAELQDVDAICQTRQTELEAQHQRRDELLERRGSLLARRDRLQELAAEGQALRARRRDLEREEWLYAQLVEAFGKDGIQALVIESAIPEIEEEANAILRRLTNNRIQITIESLRDLKGGGSRETLDVKIADELGERAYDLYSGGEAFRTDFALRVALSKVLARRAGRRLRTLIIDEGFGTQDRDGLEQLKEAIQQVSADFDKVLVVTHLDELKMAFPVQIEVTKDPELGSRFTIFD